MRRTPDGRRGRRSAACCLALLWLGACASSEDADPPPETPVSTTTLAAPDDGAGAGRPDETVETVVEEPPFEMTVSLTGRLAAEISVSSADVDEPFGTFGSCSGWRAVVGPYSVLVSVPTGDVRSISLLTRAPVDGPGVHDSDIRLEPATGEAIVVTGTMTLDAGLVSGSFTALDADGTPIAGEFSCPGGPGPELRSVGGADGVLETVEVVALLRDGDAERVLGLVAGPETVAELECPGASGSPDAAVLVRVDGDQSIGAITAFELTGGDRPTMRARAGEMVYEFDTVDVDADESATSGTFSASTTEAVTVDGAFRCT